MILVSPLSSVSVQIPLLSFSFSWTWTGRHRDKDRQIQQPGGFLIRLFSGFTISMELRLLGCKCIQPINLLNKCAKSRCGHWSGHTVTALALVCTAPCIWRDGWECSWVLLSLCCDVVTLGSVFLTHQRKAPHYSLYLLSC